MVSCTHRSIILSTAAVAMFLQPLFSLRQHHDITSWTSEGNFLSPQDVRLSMTRIGRNHQEKRQCCTEFMKIITKCGMIFLNKQLVGPQDKTTGSIIRFVSCGRIFSVWQSLFIGFLHPWWCLHNRKQRLEFRHSYLCHHSCTFLWITWLLSRSL